MMFLCEVSTLSFSRKKTLSTPYSWSVENLTNTPMGPASDFSITKFFFPLTCRDFSKELITKSAEIEPYIRLQEDLTGLFESSL